MLITKQILVSALVLGACVLNLAGCGQTGALYLPARTTPAKQTPLAPPIPSS
ncbi:MAG: lipoprotein, partial [Rhodoferax sp.]|nr:lipoprotein [Rhodoferax sp.]